LLHPSAPPLANLHSSRFTVRLTFQQGSPLPWGCNRVLIRRPLYLIFLPSRPYALGVGALSPSPRNLADRQPLLTYDLSPFFFFFPLLHPPLSPDLFPSGENGYPSPSRRDRPPVRTTARRYILSCPSPFTFISPRVPSSATLGTFVDLPARPPAVAGFTLILLFRRVRFYSFPRSCGVFVFVFCVFFFFWLTLSPVSPLSPRSRCFFFTTFMDWELLPSLDAAGRYSGIHKYFVPSVRFTFPASEFFSYSRVSTRISFAWWMRSLRGSPP